MWHVARLEKMRGGRRILVGKVGERDHFEDVGVDGRKILKWVCKKWNGSIEWTDLTQDTDRF